jgi:hypothetical protein
MDMNLHHASWCYIDFRLGIVNNIPMLPAPAPTIAIRQPDIAALLAAYRITHYPVVVRVPRLVQGGGFGDQAKNPNTWTVYFLVDNQWAYIESARGLRREWGSLDRLEIWLREQGFSYFWVRNDLEPIGPVVPPTEG